MSSGITRRKGQSGRARTVECAACGAKVPRDKAIAKRRHGLPLNRELIKRLKEQGAHLPSSKITSYYCISCAKHRKYI